jgi:hypothetical protein
MQVYVLDFIAMQELAPALKSVLKKHVRKEVPFGSSNDVDQGADEGTLMSLQVRLETGFKLAEGRLNMFGARLNMFGACLNMFGARVNMFGARVAHARAPTWWRCCLSPTTLAVSDLLACLQANPPAALRRDLAKNRSRAEVLGAAGSTTELIDSMFEDLLDEDQVGQYRGGGSVPQTTMTNDCYMD